MTTDTTRTDFTEHVHCPRCHDDWPHMLSRDRQPARVWRWFRFHDLVVVTTHLRCLTCGHTWTHQETRPAEQVR